MTLFTDEQIIAVLQQYNPWWQSPKRIESLTRPVKRSMYHQVMKIIRHRTLRRFILLSGPRRVGKTTIMMQVIAELLNEDNSPDNILYVSFDNPVLKMAGLQEIIRIYDSLCLQRGLKYLFLDEIQYADNWELWLKVYYDMKQDISIVATGSASPVLESSSADSGAGRWVVLKTPTLSFNEYCRLLQIENRPDMPGFQVDEICRISTSELAHYIGKFQNLQPHFHRYLAIGGFPELALAQDDNFAQRLLREDIVDKVIKRDIMSLFNIRSPLQLEKLFIYLCLYSGGIFSAQSASRELDNTNVKTIDSYIGFLEQANLIFRSYPHNLSGKGILKNNPKIYVADPAIRNAVLMQNNLLTNEREMGIVAETAVFKHLWSFYQHEPVNLGYYRQRSSRQKEIDIVADINGRKLLCEVKFRNDTSLKTGEAILDLAETDENVSCALVITRNLDDFGIYRYKTRIPVTRIPALPFLYLLSNDRL